MPRVLRGVGMVDLCVTVMGQKLGLPIYCSPTALQRPLLRFRAGCKICGRAEVTIRVPYEALRTACEIL